MDESSARIGIFGGSFNPPHHGHVSACRYLLAQHLVDRVLVVPCWIHPFQKSLAPYTDRLAMCRAAFAGIAGVDISEIERDLDGVSHTIRTVRHVRAAHPAAQLVLVVGADLLAEMAAWQDVAAIRAEAELLPIPRGAGGPILDVSATSIRARVARGAPIDALVPPAVAEYIARHRLYA